MKKHKPAYGAGFIYNNIMRNRHSAFKMRSAFYFAEKFFGLVRRRTKDLRTGCAVYRGSVVSSVWMVSKVKRKWIYEKNLKQLEKTHKRKKTKVDKTNSLQKSEKSPLICYNKPVHIKGTFFKSEKGA